MKFRRECTEQAELKPRLLLEHKANLKAVDGLGRSALKHAELAHHDEAAAKLAATRTMEVIGSEEEGSEAEEAEQAQADFLTQSLQSMGFQSHHA